MQFRVLWMLGGCGVLMGWVSPVRAYVDLLTRQGELWRTTDATIWNRLAQTGYPDPAGYLTGTPAWILTRQGDLLRSLDEGQTWQAVATYPFSDGVALVHDPAGPRYYAMTRSGELWRGSGPDSMNRVSGLVVHDAVDLEVLPGLSPVLLVLTRSGDVHVSLDEGSTWQLVGNTGFVDMQVLEARGDTLYALTHQGDVLRSIDTGRTWSGWRTLSQVGSVDLLIDGVGQIFVVLETSELAQYDTATASWIWLGSPSQMGVVILSRGGAVPPWSRKIPWMPRSFGCVRSGEGYGCTVLRDRHFLMGFSMGWEDGYRWMRTRRGQCSFVSRRAGSMFCVSGIPCFLSWSSDFRG